MPVKGMKLTRMGHQSPEKRDLFQRIHSGAREPRKPEPGPLSIWPCSDPKPTLARMIPKTKYRTQLTRRKTRLDFYHEVHSPHGLATIEPFLF